jgi:cyclic pyranopterin monophosphate synthase
MAKKLTHLDATGAMHMVDVGQKPATHRMAIAEARVSMSRDAREALLSGNTKKGDVLAAVRLAGIQGAKRTSELIPLCHLLALSHVAIDVQTQSDGVVIVARAETTAPTGVEMEALTAASVAALTLYDMLKAVDRAMVIGPIQLLEKHGGASGSFARPKKRG